MHAEKHPHKIIYKKKFPDKHNLRSFCGFFSILLPFLLFPNPVIHAFRGNVDAIHFAVGSVYRLIHCFPHKVDNLWITFQFHLFFFVEISAFCLALDHFSTAVDRGSFFCW